jgi:putative tricarboxylic transport membrane protein
MFRAQVIDVVIMILVGVIGYLFRKFVFEEAPMALAFVLGPRLDMNLRPGRLASQGSFLKFFTQPIFAVTLCLSAAPFLSILLPPVMKRLQL